jgi:hypothetical protein
MRVYTFVTKTAASVRHKKRTCELDMLERAIVTLVTATTRIEKSTETGRIEPLVDDRGRRRRRRC